VETGEKQCGQLSYKSDARIKRTPGLLDLDSAPGIILATKWLSKVDLKGWRAQILASQSLPAAKETDHSPSDQVKPPDCQHLIVNRCTPPHPLFLLEQGTPMGGIYACVHTIYPVTRLLWNFNFWPILQLPRRSSSPYKIEFEHCPQKSNWSPP
jgi:hypothetical protein